MTMTSRTSHGLKPILLAWVLGLVPLTASAAADYAVGADLSFLKQAEDRGTVFKDKGQAKPGLQIFRDHGYNWIRLRLFHTPTRLPNNLEYTIALAQDARKLGYRFLLDFHYSDTWADPAKQIIPKAWEGKSHTELVQAVREYTRDTIAAFRKAGVLPDMVQPGNEITPGMLWPDGKLPANWDNFAGLLKAAIEGVKAGSGDATPPRIMIHIDKGGNKDATKWFFDKLNSYNIPYDVIGQSFYPWWHGSLVDLRENLAFMAETYHKDIIVVEAAYNWRPTEYENKEAPFPETPEGQKQFLAEVNRAVLETPHGLGKGVFWWEPAVPAGSLRSRGMFDNDGHALPVITVFDESTRRVEVKSPDGRVVLSLEVKDFEGAASCPVYSVAYRGKDVIAPSRLGLVLSPTPLGGLQIVRQTPSSVDTQWKPVYGERSTIRDHYNQVSVELQEQNAPKRLLHLTLRAYDEGAAFCYTLPKQTGLEQVTIARELTEFRFPADYSAWATYTAQGVYTNVPLSQIRRGCERPLVVRAADDMYAAVAEARLVDYARMRLSPLSNVPNSLVADLGSEVAAPLPLRTPWRVIMLADSPGQLLEHNDIILNLNDACALADTSWIRPGKVIREATLTTVGGKACVDFAVKHHLQYVEFDAGWYGPENDDASDARRVHLDPKRSKGPLDLQEVIRYGAERGIGILLYVNHKALERQLDELLPLYQQWGVKGIKFGFVNVGTQKWTSWMHEAIRKAAEHHLMVDVHDEYRPTGWSRTYPNFMTQEGIRGDEERQPNNMTLTTAFTRLLAGAADNTICYYDQRVDQQSSHAYQLAKTVCLYSPWQFLYWYDRPSPSRDAAGRNLIGAEPELEFFDACPTVWDDTRVLQSSIGEYAVIARRSGANWFIGGMNSDEPRSFDIPLSFLDAGRQYVAHIYSDDPAVPTRTHVKVQQHTVDCGTVLKMVLPARGGQALRITPATTEE